MCPKKLYVAPYMLCIVSTNIPLTIVTNFAEAFGKKVQTMKSLKNLPSH